MTPLNVESLIKEAQIKKRVQELGQQIAKDFKGKSLLAVGVLNGSFIFYSDLIREIDADIHCEFIGISSYHNSNKSSGEVKVTMDLTTSVQGRDVLIVEDIVDTGLTLDFLQKSLMLRGARSVCAAALLFKPKALKAKLKIDYVGFEIGNEFVVGYGLDYQGFYRNLPYIAQVSNIN